MLKRRQFLGLAAAAPLGAKAAVASIADMAVMPQATNLGAIGLGVSGGGYPGGALISNAIAPDKSGVIAWITKNGFPEFLKKECWEQARYVSTFDPDIAVNRSMSLTAKVSLQRQRNYKRLLSGRDPRNSNTSDERESFFKKFNFWI